tara:strand:+ start:393 stop:629 length:237 start_codon:yes stop_codon:yes gene_type:complete
MRHKAICYDDHGKLECCCDLRDAEALFYEHLCGCVVTPAYAPSVLPTDGAQIKMSELDSKSDLQDLIDDCERFRGNHG